MTLVLVILSSIVALTLIEVYHMEDLALMSSLFVIFFQT